MKFTAARLAKSVGIILIFGLVIASFWLWHPLDDDFDEEAAIITAQNYSVEIIRDDFGVPHIYGPRDADALFGLAYAQAEDDFQTIQEIVAVTRGKLARYRGVDGATTDYLVSLFKVWETIEKDYETKVPDHLKELAEAQAAGMNLFAAQHPEQTWRGLAPFTAKDVIAGFVFKTPFFYGLDGTLLPLFGDKFKQQIALDPAQGRQSWSAVAGSPAERGSNAFAVSPERSGDQKTRLLINSHQPFTGPVAWYEAHIVSEQGLDITGGTFPGAPLILHGFNRHLGWANTVNKPDLSDTYVLTVNPKNKNQYRLDEEWIDFEKSEAKMQIKLFGPFAFPVKRDVLFSRHGPVIQSKHGTYAVRYAGMGEIRQFEQYYKLNRAQSLAEFMSTLSMNALPSINYIYADKEGNIGFIHNGQFPDRNDEWDWSHQLPGDRSDLIWSGYRSFATVPKLINPKSGFIFNANNTPFIATDGDDNLKASDFPQSMGLKSVMTNRALRITELTDGASPLSRETLLAIKFDNQYSEKSKAMEIVKEVLAMDWNAEPDLEQAAAHLAKWDGSTNLDNPYAALGVHTVIHEITEEFTNIKAPSREKAFRDAVDILMKNFGTIDVPWRKINLMVRADTIIPVNGGPDILRAIYPAELREDGRFHANAGDSWIALVEWDENGNQTADIIHQYGSATTDKSSPNYDNQMPIFAREQFRSAHIKRKDVIAVATRIYNPTKN